MGLLKQWLRYETADLVSPLPPAQCVERLRAALDEDGAPVLGNVGTASLRLRKVLGENVHNSFQTYLRATLDAAGAGTRLNCRFGPHPFVVAFMLFWFLAVLGFLVGFSIFFAGSVGDPMARGMTTIIPIFMFVFGIGMVTFGRHWSRDEARFLLEFLQQTIAARPVTLGKAAPSESVVQR
jgi:hypothetical protein